MADTPFPDWENFPSLEGIIRPDDLDTKGTGKFAASYVNWAKVSQLLREHARGWQFELRSTADPDGGETHVFRAPDNSGYLVGFFRAPTGSGFCDTPDFPQAIMDARPVLNPDGTPKMNKWGSPMMDANASIPWAEITARDVTDTHRRCMCTAAAAHFGLAYEIWAKEEIENPMRESVAPPKPSAKPPANPPAQSNADTSDKAGELQDMRGVVSAALLGIFKKDESVHPKWVSALKGKFPTIGAKSPKVEVLNMEQLLFSTDFISSYKIEKQDPKK